MKYWIHNIFTAVCIVLMLVSCQEDLLPGQSIVGDKVDVVLRFGATDHSQIEVKTRSTYDPHYESMVRNVYAFIFANDQKVYGRFFSAEDLDNNSAKEYWTVQNMTAGNSSVQTKGELHISVPSVSNDAEIVLVANIDLDFMNLSQDRLGLVRTKMDLQNMLVSLNQVIPDRNAGFFMMTGSKQGVSISSTGQVSISGDKITLERLDAKVNVNVRINPTQINGNQRVESFTPESWSVVNLPQMAHLIPNDGVLELTEESFFNIDPRNFETSENEMIGGSATGAVLHGFSFYMLENKRSAQKKKSVEGNYHNRDRRIKNLDNPYDDSYGTYNTENGMWEYAPEQSTYIKVKGELKLIVDPGLPTEHNVVADVTYVVHLGDFASDKDNYDILRNTHYTYTININGVNNIEVEVETSNDNLKGIIENQPGAMGHLYDAETNIYTLDAHYAQMVFTIRGVDVNVDSITWYIRTPFGREGVPQKDALGNEIYSGMDYKWVEFILNDKEDGSNLYKTGNMKYPANKEDLMSVIDMIALVKKETVAWRRGEESLYDDNGELRFTVFVDEYYYAENPMNPNDEDVLWKKFVNQPPRLLHILRNNNTSADGESSVTRSMLTIRQNAIQTPYNLSLSHTSLTEAWGCEITDEMKNQAWFFHPNERMKLYDDQANPYNTPHVAYNTSQDDGLYNTACLLNLVQGSNYVMSVNTSLRWDTFLDYSQSELQLKPDYKAGLYSVLLRNRDTDGDGIIDPEELRWYIASVGQLCCLFIGDQGLSTDAQLYPIDTSLEPNIPIASGPFAGVYPWRLHVVSSTAWQSSAGGQPTVVWAEEGASTGQYQQHWSKAGLSPIKCVRNLGMKDATSSAIVSPGSNYPKDPLIIATPHWNESTVTHYTFDLRNMNKQSQREYYTTHELVPSNEYAPMSRVYEAFETGPVETFTYVNHPYNELKNLLASGGSPSPDGYRVPNIREAVIMHLYANGLWWAEGNELLVSSYYSFGEHGYGYDVGCYSWNVASWSISLAGTPSKIRFVRDIKL